MIDLDLLIESAKELEPLPASSSRLASMLTDINTPLHEIVKLVSFDQALTARVLRAANSALSGARAPITTIDAAVARLGPGTILALTVGSAVKGQMGGELPFYGLGEGELWKHSVAAALAADLLRKRRPAKIPAEAFTAALLHDLGKLVLGRYVRNELRQWFNRAEREGGLSRRAAEQELIEVNHAEIGGLIARDWGLPETISWGITYHHDPRLATPGEGDPLCDTVFLSDVLAKEALGELGPNDVPPGLDQEVMARFQINDDDRAVLKQTIIDSLHEVMSWYD
ncbi:MAG: HDOD domain-containing protein [Planctomycetota bacterium]